MAEDVDSVTKNRHAFSAAECRRRLARALEHSSFVKFMLEKMEEAGCSVARTVDAAQDMKDGRAGGAVSTSATEKDSNAMRTNDQATSFFSVEYCDGANAKVVGGFRPERGVALCHNNLTSQADLENTLTHELIHAYDHCRAKGMDWTNCEHHACTEVRLKANPDDWIVKSKSNLFSLILLVAEN